MSVSRITPRQRLADLMVEGVVLNEVFVENVDPGALALIGVTVESIGREFVVFNQAGSGGVGRVVVRIDSITAIDLPY